MSSDEPGFGNTVNVPGGVLRMRTDEWIGRETFEKERDFTGLMGIHVRVCKSIRGRHSVNKPYLWVDLHGGPGHLRDDDGREFDGSPLIANELLTASGLPYEAMHFERDSGVAARLRDALDGYACAAVSHTDYEAGMNRRLKGQKREEHRYGMVYSDPIGDPLPVSTFIRMSLLFPKVDLLAYVAANNQYKRVNGRGHDRILADDIEQVREHKKHVLIREPRSAEQYTFVLFTNWTEFPRWENRGFHSIDSPQGVEIVEHCSMTHAQRRDYYNPRMPLEGLG